MVETPRFSGEQYGGIVANRTLRQEFRLKFHRFLIQSLPDILDLLLAEGMAFGKSKFPILVLYLI